MFVAIFRLNLSPSEEDLGKEVQENTKNLKNKFVFSLIIVYI